MDRSTAQALTVDDLKQAIGRLERSEVGARALTKLLAFCDEAAIDLDDAGKHAVLVLLHGVFGEYTGTARDLMRTAVQS